MGLILLLGIIGLIAGFVHAVRSRDGIPMIAVKTVGGFMAGAFVSILLLITIFRGWDA